MLPRNGPGPTGPGDLPGGGRPNADPMQMLVNSTPLQAELKLEQDQLRKLQRIEFEFRNKLSDLLQQMSAAGSPQKLESVRGALRAHVEVGRGMIARVLTRPQLDRLQQIMVQVEGTCSAVRDENASRALGLQPQQMRRIAELCQRMQSAIGPPPPAASLKERCASMQQARIKFEKARQETEAGIATVLSDAQRQSLRAMAGVPFHMEPPTPPECR